MIIVRKISGWGIAELPEELEKDYEKLTELLPYSPYFYGHDFLYKLILQGQPLKYQKIRKQLYDEIGDNWEDEYLRFNH